MDDDSTPICIPQVFEVFCDYSFTHFSNGKFAPYRKPNNDPQYTGVDLPTLPPSLNNYRYIEYPNIYIINIEYPNCNRIATSTSSCTERKRGVHFQSCEYPLGLIIKDNGTLQEIDH